MATPSLVAELASVVHLIGTRGLGTALLEVSLSAGRQLAQLLPFLRKHSGSKLFSEERHVFAALFLGLSVIDFRRLAVDPSIHLRDLLAGSSPGRLELQPFIPKFEAPPETQGAKPDDRL